MRAGELRHRILFQKKDDDASNINGETTWNDFASAWAKIVTTSGSQTSDNQNLKTESQITLTITIRFLRELKPDMRIVYEGRIFTMKVIDNLEERNREIEIQAVEETDI